MSYLLLKLANNARNNTPVKLYTISNLDGIIIKIITENINILKRVCRNIVLGIFRAWLTTDF